MEIGEVLSKAWKIIWKNKILWIFGILASCSSGGGGGGSAGNSANDPNMQQGMTDTLNNIDPAILAMIVIGILIVAFVIAVIAIFLTTVGKVGLIRGTMQADESEAKLSFGELFRGSTPFFWRVFGLQLLVGLMIFVVVGAGVAIAVAGTVLTLGIGAICLVPLLCLCVPIGWVVSLVVEQSTIAIVAENLGIGAGLGRGWTVVKSNIGMMLLMGLILSVGIGLIVGFIIFLPLTTIMGLFVVAMMTSANGENLAGLIVPALCLIAYIPVMIALSGIVTSYTTAAWTLTFKRLTRPSAPAPAPVDTWSNPPVIPG